MRWTCLLLLGALACGRSHSPTPPLEGCVAPFDAAFDAAPRDAGIAIDIDADIDADTDADTAIDATIDAATDTDGVPCGDTICESPTAICTVCPHETGTHGHCFAADDDPWPFGTAFREHEFCGFPGLFIQCNGPEDCPRDDRECVFTEGEWGYGQCLEVGTGFIVACHDDADCDRGRRCEDLPLDYFTTYSDLLGWIPRGCVEVD